jgi:hypothetical protein
LAGGAYVNRWDSALDGEGDAMDDVVCGGFGFRGGDGGGKRGALRALIAEDDVVCRKMLAKQLGSLGVVDVHLVVEPDI